MRLSRRLWLTGLALALGAASLGADPAPKPRPIGEATTALPGPLPGGGFDLPNGWRITPAGKQVADLNDLILKMVVSPDGKVIIAGHSGYLPHGLSVIDAKSHKVVQEVPLKTTWLGLAWSGGGHTLYVSGGNANGEKKVEASLAPIYALAYRDGRLDAKPVATFTDDTTPKDKTWWSGLLSDPKRGLVWAANRGTSMTPTDVVAFDTKSGAIRKRVHVGISPYELALSKDGRRLFVSDWGEKSVSVVDVASQKVIKTIPVGFNPNDMVLAPDGRLFVACSNENTVYVIDTRTLTVLETISTALYPKAPLGSTPNSLALDLKRKLLFVANADNNDVAVVDIHKRETSAVTGFIPAGWYTSAVTLGEADQALYIGATKGEEGHPDLKGPTSPLASKFNGDETVKTLQRSSVERLPLAGLKASLARYTRQVYANTPYNDALLTAARAPAAPSIMPSKVGQGSPIKYIVYIIKENRTYDQVYGDLPHTNGDPRLAIFGRQITPNQHAMAEQFAAFDNCYTDGDVSQDGHSWANAAYATDQNEKSWPANYGGHSQGANRSMAYMPSNGYLWDAARRKGLTYRSYGEYATRASTGEPMSSVPGANGLIGHVSPSYLQNRVRDTENAKVFLTEFAGYEANFDSPDPEKRLPNYIVMSMQENHTHGTDPKSFSPRAMVANQDVALGRMIERLTHSPYWPQMAIFIMEDDAQDGPDHVDARRTACLVISPYIKRGTVDSTLYTTSSMVRSIELLLGMPPLSQYDAAATPFYAAFGTTADLTGYKALPAQYDVNEMNPPTAYGARESAKMNFADADEAPMHRLNEIIWKSVKGAGSPMPPPVHRYRALVGPEE
ncbi:MAG TPA: alkaline phosphatase family protein [Phenylobacterium sp.]|jgi:YVTN family beta-propeller protein|uniref:bifunctional YncE family protein/alkaline phosphatase family protein n=1 Tax=Phenylobacterium sp. TaxID=1871053 RepID=UPI002D6FCDA6|nr:alkaline phosphatase family protein [Phenylobacterium sp.]HZZ67877.1 alkaline phosphatase family protein [Phenylobacterium sp.]